VADIAFPFAGRFHDGLNKGQNKRDAHFNRSATQQAHQSYGTDSDIQAAVI
jgi:hypothetical protein